ncbi:MAG: Ig-like domain-containing protein [Anaerolineae bacterium]|nr:Ig-like domain-containing protein [Anaerolineae bacterium]
MSRHLSLVNILMAAAFLALIGLLLMLNREQLEVETGYTDAAASLTPTSPSAAPEPLRITLDPSVPVEAFTPQSQFILHFSQPMNPESVLTALLIEPTMMGQEVWSNDNQTLTFTQEMGYVANTIYTFTLHPKLQIGDGAYLAHAPLWTIQTIPGPVVLKRSQDMPFTQNRRAPVQLHFDRLMDANSVAAALIITPTLPVHTSLISHTLIITPAQPLMPGETYQLTLNDTATDLDGLKLHEPYSWRIVMLDTYKLSNRFNNIEAGSPLVIQFNYPLDPTSFQLHSEPPLNGVISWQSDQMVFTYTLTTRPIGDTRYTLSLPDTLRDQHGDLLPLNNPQTFAFTTPSRIRTAAPAANSQPVSLMSGIHINFTVAMDHKATEAAVSINPPVVGAFTWQENSLLFTPSVRLLPETTYTVTLGHDALDDMGTPIQLEPYTWSFQTGAETALATLGNGEPVQLLLAGGRKAIPYSFAPNQPPLPATFDLYQLTLAQWQAGQSGDSLTQWAEPPTPATTNAIHVQETFLPETIQPGIYRLTLTVAGVVEDELVLFLSDRVLLAKTDGHTLLTWVTTGDAQPAAAAPIAMYSSTHQLLHTGQADAQGLYRLEQPPFTPAYLISQQGDDVSFTYLASAYVYDEPDGAISTQISTLYSDRPVYYPGQTINFRGIMRLQQQATLTIPPAGTPIQVQLQNSAGQIIGSQTLLSSDFGTVNGQWVLNNAAAPGPYTLRLSFNGIITQRVVDVQPQPNPSYRLTVTTDAPTYADGDNIGITVTLYNAQGQPIPNQEITLSYYWDNNSGYWVSRQWSIPWRLEQETHHTDEQGQFTISREATLHELTSWGTIYDNTISATWAVQASFTEQEQMITQFAVYQVFSSGEQITLELGNRFQPVGQSFPVTVRVTNLGGEPVRGRALSLNLLIHDPGGYSQESIHTLSVTTDAQGQATIPYQISQAGYYLLQVSNGAGVTVAQPVLAYGSGQRGNFPTRIIILRDKDVYAPGETAQIAILSAHSGAVLLTTAQGRLRDEQVVQLTPPLTMVELPLTDAAATNLTLSLAFWEPQSGSENNNYPYRNRPQSLLHSYVLGLTIRDPRQTLHLALTPQQENHTPGAAAAFTVRVTNGLGEPVSAELSFALSDAAIYTTYPDPLLRSQNAFHIQLPDQTWGYHGLKPSRDLSWSLGEDWGHGGCGGYWFEPITLTNRYDTAGYWHGSWQTDANGEATITLTLPTNSTIWRITALALTADTQIGATSITLSGD